MAENENKKGTMPIYGHKIQICLRWNYKKMKLY